MPTAVHVPVLVEEVMGHLRPRSGDRLLDATLGQGGHAAAYLNLSGPAGEVVGLDADDSALAAAKERLTPFGDRVTLRHANFAHLNEAVNEANVDSANRPFHHILFDLGIGSHQLTDLTRGFSFAGERSLSMRYGSRGGLPPAKVDSLNRLQRRLGYEPDVVDILQHTTEEELADILYMYGEERFRGRIARALHQRPHPATGQELAKRVSEAVPGHYRRGRLHPATRTFQALRLAVNRELEALETALPAAYDLLAPGGTLVVISFHSLEDRIVKTAFRRFKAERGARILTRKPISASAAELAANPRARSAKLRAIERPG